ncbi:MAG: LysM peptidoglycan-binding domain-containing protein [Myxococcota bacterium]
MKRTLLVVVVALFCVSPAAAERRPFPRPAALDPDVGFWTRVFTEVDTSGGLIHDDRDLGIVYEVVSLPKGLSARARQRHVEKLKRGYRLMLQSLARGKRTSLSSKEKRVLGLFPKNVSNATLRTASGRLRFQLGQADKFRAGLIRSGAWEPHIRKTFRDLGLPAELASLPHVESSYTPYAYSRVGAAGLWQFTRSTGRRFVRVDHVVDERLDPLKSTVAAARLLEQNRLTTGTWPLAITAYNHGAAGMRRAVRKLGTRDITTIVREYRSRTFGFASRNFYIEFLAAVDVDSHARKYFGKLRLDEPIAYEVVKLPYFTSASALQRALGVDLDVLKRANPALRSSVWRGSKYIPRAYAIHIPREQLARPISQLVDEIPKAQRFAAQQRDTFHFVRRGETLSKIASRYRVSMSELVAINGLRSRHRIRAGQRLRLPDNGGSRTFARASTTASRSPAPAADSTAALANGEYRVRRGDTLSRIAARLGVDQQELMRVNGLRSPNRIYAGQRLRLREAPASSEPAAPPVEEAAVAAVEPPTVPEGKNEVAQEIAETSGLLAAETEAGSQSEAEETPTLVADPSDYSVSSDGRIEVQAVETLGHYAEWLNVRASRLRALNRMRYGEPVVVGQSLRLDLSRVSAERFEEQRIDYHHSVQDEFFERFEIAGTQVHVMRRGDSLWDLSRREYRVPLWLLRQYNPDLQFDDLKPGTLITIPRLKPHGDDFGSTGAAESGRADGKPARDSDGEA